ncbi:MULTISPECIES: M20 family metallo-hydrolase [unclassified Haloferax]|uniref:M20 family metallo-hydrolase n=1 Tax=unclassified Haloferax TaxID=2625095 RepID=UPI0002B206B1|nr:MULTISPECIES: M20 family metallo-hydrolase [unclassified Haloferax]ELZ55960.1 N-carbamoyl-L-amino acid amidohydrolase [Haloferax sp. ATCC BAA-646]ELZ67715.1 N-carbamoyl-L-amino acid amidohydrolase [Haloferax sp. ATCC BAA-645]ELZ68285.1 N-carbamoyl-L-amino acid amidohydrolase [Haloferax sp. ATCC BAA-644]
MQASQQRLREDIEANARFGDIDAPAGRGRTVLTGSDADRRAREFLVERLRDADLSVRIDAVGTIAGRWVPDGADPDAAPVAAGSHLDSVPEGGIFDGPLGVYAALEAVRTLQERDAGASLDRPIDVVSFTEEEGARFSHGLLGSSVATGARDADDALALRDADGTTLDAHLDAIGFRGTDTIDAAAWDAWAELHIEQGTVLESAGAGVGVVDAITGITTCAADIVGEADHAGATPMDERRDALVAASEFVVDVRAAADDVAQNQSSTAVGTVGQFDVAPNARNIVPGEVTLQMDIRDVDYRAMDAIAERAEAALDELEAAHPVETSFDRYRDQRPSRMADDCVAAALDAAATEDIDAKRMHSAAMHDTANVAGVTDAVLLFAPSADGLSHNPREWTDWADCATAASVLAGTLARLAGA